MPFVIGAVVLIAAVIVLYLLALKPRPEPKTSVEPLRVDYAHRGLHGRDGAVENTMSAFRAASEAGYGIELDVRLSSDGEVVVFHDSTLERLCGIRKRVDEMTASELSWVDIRGTYEKIPLFSDVLRSIDPSTPLIIELKEEGRSTELCEKVAKMLDEYDGYFSVESFNPLMLNWFRKYRPRFVRGQLTTDLFKSGKDQSLFNKIGCKSMFLNFLSKPDYISYDCRYPNYFSLKVCEKLYHALMFTWCVDNDKDYAEAKASGRIVIFQDYLPPSPKEARKSGYIRR